MEVFDLLYKKAVFLNKEEGFLMNDEEEFGENQGEVHVFSKFDSLDLLDELGEIEKNRKVSDLSDVDEIDFNL